MTDQTQGSGTVCFFTLRITLICLILFLKIFLFFLFGGESMNTKKGMCGANVHHNPFFLLLLFP
jgi:hypothetical protein